MIQVENTTYNPETDGFMPIAPGTYPAHVAGLESRELTTKNGEQKHVFNLTFLVDESVSKMSIPKLVKNGDGEYHPAKNEDGTDASVSGEYMKGKRFSSVGLWLTPQPEEGKRWQNRRYVEFFESLAVEFPQDKEGNTQLAIVEEEDVIGKPCFIKLNKESYEKDGEQRYVWKAFEVFPWHDGEVLSGDEVKSDDLPF